MSNGRNQCATCNSFDRYYTKEKTQFARTKFGLCCKKRTNVENCDSCELYSFKKYEGKAALMTIKLKLNDMLSQLSALRMYLEDENYD